MSLSLSLVSAVVVAIVLVWRDGSLAPEISFPGACPVTHNLKMFLVAIFWKTLHYNLTRINIDLTISETT